MERSSDHDEIATALAEARPAPRDAFVEELDERVAAGFPRRSRFEQLALGGPRRLDRGLSPQRLLFAGGAAALAAIAIATVVVATNDSAPGSRPTSGLLSHDRPHWRRRFLGLRGRSPGRRARIIRERAVLRAIPQAAATASSSASQRRARAGPLIRGRKRRRHIRQPTGPSKPKASPTSRATARSSAPPRSACSPTPPTSPTTPPRSSPRSTTPTASSCTRRPARARTAAPVSNC